MTVVEDGYFGLKVSEPPGHVLLSSSEIVLKYFVELGRDVAIIKWKTEEDMARARHVPY